MIRRRAFLLALTLAAVLTTAGCGADEREPPADAGGGTAAVGADLLASRRQGITGHEVPTVGGEMSEVAPEALPPGPPVVPGAQQDPAARDTFDVATLGFDAGREGAPVRIMEFSDFGCGYCRKFHMETYPALLEEYVETGKVRWKYVTMISGMFGPPSEQAAQAGECAGEQGRFPAMRDRIFEEQGRWKNAPDPMAVLRGLAREVGADMQRWERCVTEGWRTDRVRAGTQLANQVGVRGTPTFYIAGMRQPIPGAIPLELFREVLDTVLALSDRAGESGPGR